MNTKRSMIIALIAGATAGLYALAPYQLSQLRQEGERIIDQANDFNDLEYTQSQLDSIKSQLSAANRENFAQKLQESSDKKFVGFIEQAINEYEDYQKTSTAEQRRLLSTENLELGQEHLSEMSNALDDLSKFTSIDSRTKEQLTERIDAQMGILAQMITGVDPAAQELNTIDQLLADAQTAIIDANLDQVALEVVRENLENKDTGLKARIKAATKELNISNEVRNQKLETARGLEEGIKKLMTMSEIAQNAESLETTAEITQEQERLNTRVLSSEMLESNMINGHPINTPFKAYLEQQRTRVNDRLTQIANYLLRASRLEGLVSESELITAGLTGSTFEEVVTGPTGNNETEIAKTELNALKERADNLATLLEDGITPQAVLDAVTAEAQEINDRIEYHKNSAVAAIALTSEIRAAKSAYNDLTTKLTDTNPGPKALEDILAEKNITRDSTEGQTLIQKIEDGRETVKNIKEEAERIKNLAINTPEALHRNAANRMQEDLNVYNAGNDADYYPLIVERDAAQAEINALKQVLDDAGL